MPGFFESMKRIAQGKPVFDPTDQQPPARSYGPYPQAENTPSAEPHAEPSLIQKGNDRTFPVVYIRQVKAHLDGQRMELYARIVNTWPQDVELTSIRLLGTHHELETKLHPNEEREFLIYKGPWLKSKYPLAQLDYKTHHERDYFEAIHDVGFFYHENEKAYTVDEIKLRPPIRDILG